MIGFNESIKELGLEPGDLDYDPEVKIVTRGIPLDYITGIVPLGSEERKILEF